MNGGSMRDATCEGRSQIMNYYSLVAIAVRKLYNIHFTLSSLCSKFYKLWLYASHNSHWTYTSANTTSILSRPQQLARQRSSHQAGGVWSKAMRMDYVRSYKRLLAVFA
eukprot:3132621-Pleurochrysis_carterae.AAC.1